MKKHRHKWKNILEITNGELTVIVCKCVDCDSVKIYDTSIKRFVYHKSTYYEALKELEKRQIKI